MKLLYVSLLLLSTGLLANTLDAAEVTPLFSKPVPAIADDQELQLITVEYQPGESSPAHRHNAYTLVYVLEGAITVQVKGADPVTLQVGQTFYESPTDIHLVSQNASNTKKAKFVVYFLKQAGAPISAAPK